MMWTVVAADDEGYIREALRKLIDWDKMGCQLLAVASDGQELLEKIKEISPDIVITDIRMPEMDGLAVAEYVDKTCPDTQVIILTAYSDFAYAKQAIRFGVCGYVLKVSIMEELPEAVEKAALKLAGLRKQIERAQEGPKGQESLIRQIEEYVEEHYRSKLSLEEIAEALHVNRSYLSRVYKSRTGVNLFDAILNRRMEAAKDYLMHTDMRTYEIAEAVGIEDAGYFSKMFKRTTGLSPKEYRKSR